MNIDRFLQLLTLVAWISFGVFVVVRFFRTAQKKGIKDAFQSLAVRRVLLPLLVVLAITFMSAAIIFIEPQNKAVVVSALARRGIRSQPLEAGLQWVVPLLEEAVIYPIYWQTYTMSKNPLEGEEVGDDSITARTSDGQEVFIDCSVIFRLDPEQVVRIHREWQQRYTREFVRPLVRGIVRTEVSQFTVSEVNSSKRRDLETELQRRLHEALEDKGLILDAFVLRNVTFSPEYASSVEQKQVALEGAYRRDYEAEQIRKLARGEADRTRIRAEAEATAIVIKADADARARVLQAQAEAQALQLVTGILAGNPDLMTYRYIEKLSPSIRVMLLPHDTPLILPLPTMAPGEMELATPTPTPTAAETPLPVPITPTVTLTPTLPLGTPAPTP